jgi:hypothetical protein
MRKASAGALDMEIDTPLKWRVGRRQICNVAMPLAAGLSDDRRFDYASRRTNSLGARGASLWGRRRNKALTLQAVLATIVLCFFPGLGRNVWCHYFSQCRGRRASPRGRAGDGGSTYPWRLDIFGRMVGGMADEYQPDAFSVVVKMRGQPPNRWKWEIYRAGRSSALEQLTVLFPTAAAANRAGKEPLARLLKELEVPDWE